MPVYQYEGVHYELPDGLTPEQAKAKILSHLGKSESKSPGVLDMAGGALETLTTGAVDAFGGLASQVYGSVKGALTPGKTASQGMEEAAQGYQDSTFHKVLAPQTETGKYIEHKIGEVVGDYKEEAAKKAEEVAAQWESPTMKAITRGTFATLSTVPEFLLVAGAGKSRNKADAIRDGALQPPKAKTADVDGALSDIITAKEGGADRPPTTSTPLPENIPVTPEGQGVLSPQDAFFKKKAEMEANIARAAKNGAPEGMEVTPGDPFAQMKQQLGTPQRIVENSPVMAALARRLEGEQPSPLRSQMELPFEQRPELNLQREAMDLPKKEMRPVEGTQGEMFGPLMDLEGKGEMLPREKRPATGEEMKQGELPVDEPQFKLESEGEMAPPVQRELFNKGAQQDMFGDNLVLDPNAKLPKLPENSIYEQMRAEAEAKRAAEHQKAVDSDPRVIQAEERVSKAEQAYIKAAADLQEGRLNQAHLDRLSKDMEIVADAANFIKNRVAEELKLKERKAKEISGMGAMSRQRGAVDIGPLADLVKKAIERLKVFDIPIVRDAVERYNVTQNPKEFADAIRAAKEAGVNGEMAKALDDAYTAAANKTVGEMENLIEQKGQRKPPGPRPGWKGPKNQRGYILLEGKKQKALQNLVNKADIEVKLQEIAPSQWTVADALEHIKKAQDVVQGWVGDKINYLTKGGQYLALKTHNPMVRFIVERFIDADRLARADVAKWLHTKDTGLTALMRNMSNKEAADIWAVVNYADLHQQPIDLVKLAERGFSKAQIDYVKGHQNSMAYAMQMINKAREAAGLEPVSPRAAYAAMQSTGDFRSLVYDKKGGNIIGVISSNFKPRLNRLRSQMEGKGYFVEKERYFGGGPRERGSANEAFLRATEMLAEHDPRIAQFVDVLNDIRTTEINNFLNMKRHTMEKKGIFGMEGRKEWESAYQNAVDGFNTQVNYMEASIKWGHLAEAFRDAKDVMKAPESAHMPKAKEISERYAYNALGFNPSEIGRSFENAVATMFKELGVGYSVGRTAMAKARYYTNAMLLTMRPSFWYQNIVQPLQSMPGMKADLIARGLDAGFDFGTGYSYMAQGANTAIRTRSSEVLTGFEAQALQYARKHHVYGSDLVEHSNHVRKGAGHYVDQMNNFFAGNIESATRQVAFYTFAHMLRENGMTPKNGLFEAAHNLTDIMMNNYSAVERPQLYNVAGPLGDLAVNLQSYKHNELSRVAMFVRDSAEHKSLRPVAADMMSRFAFGGVMGLIAYNEVDSIFKFATKQLGHPMSLSNLVYKASEGAGKYLSDATGGRVNQPYLVSNGIHSMMGLDLSRSLGLTDVIPDNLGEALFPGGSKIAEGVGAAYEFAKSPTEMNAKRAAYANAPLAAQGALNNAWFTKGEGDNRIANRPRDLKAQAYRNDADYYKKMAGFTGIEESVQRQKTFNIENINRDYADLRQGPLNNMRDALYAGGKIKGADVAKYLDYRGNPATLEGDLQRYAREQRLTPQELAYLKAETSSAVGALQKARDYAEAFKK